MPSGMPTLLFECRRALHVGSQGALGVLLGSSERTGQRWETGRSHPGHDALAHLATLVYPHDASLAAQVAAAMGTNLVALGIARPPAPPPPPPPPPLPAEDVVDAVVCAAAEAIDVTPREVRPALMAAFTRARRLGLSVVEVEKALGKAVTAVAPAAAAPAKKA
jgi:hypothetical protein